MSGRLGREFDSEQGSGLRENGDENGDDDRDDHNSHHRDPSPWRSWIRSVPGATETPTGAGPGGTAKTA